MPASRGPFCKLFCKKVSAENIYSFFIDKLSYLSILLNMTFNINKSRFKKEAVNKFNEFLKINKLKMTYQRELILDVFLDIESHLSSEELYNFVKDKDKSIGQVTVYRALKLLSESGIAKESNFGDKITRYEHEFCHEHHDHLICEGCKKIIEIFNPQIEAIKESVARSEGFILNWHRMDLFGVCAECQKKNR
jgi:Fur family ferric uptake transcriptional regulator